MHIEYEKMYPTNYKKYVDLIAKIGTLVPNNKETPKLTASVQDDNHRIIWEGPTRFSVVLNEKSTLGYFYLEQLPGCCGVIVLNTMQVCHGYTHLGIGLLLNELAKEIAKVHGYTVMLATDKHNNLPQRRILMKNNWVDVHQFVNKRTENTVDISIVDL